MVSLYNIDIGKSERRNVERVLESGQLASGTEVESFEEEFADFCGTDTAVATSNGTTALHAALHGLGIGPGDAVVTTPFSFVATANTIRLCGATPRFADIDPETYNIDPEAVDAKLSTDDDIRAVIAVHLYGLPADMDRLRETCDKHGVSLVEDAAQAHGATYDGDKVGSLGDVACFSFYPTKNMTTSEGGMVTTDDTEIAARVRRFRNHGRDGEGRIADVGHNFRMTNVEAAIGRAQLDKLPEFVSARQSNAAFLTDTLADTPLTLPVEPEHKTHSYHQYTVRGPDREKFRAHLENNGVETGVYYTQCIHQQQAYGRYNPSVPNAEEMAESVVQLPVHPRLEEAELTKIVNTIKEYDW